MRMSVGGAPEAVAPANSSISRRVTDGESRASPPATALMPARSSSGGVRLRRNPLAPGADAS